MGLCEAPWPETIRRWQQEGLPLDIHFSDYFEMDIRDIFAVDSSFRLPVDVLEEADEFVLSLDCEGNRVRRFKDRSGASMTLEYAIKTADDWAGHKERLDANLERVGFGQFGDYWSELVNENWQSTFAAYQARQGVSETFVLLGVLNVYEGIRPKLGDERVLLWMADQPDILHEMFNAHAECVMATVRLLQGQKVTFDGVVLGGDICNNQGMLISPAMYREMILPYDRRMIQFFKSECGLPVIFHSDGNCRETIPMYIEAGVDCLQPLQARAGLDVRELKDLYGDQLAFMGNIRAEALAGTRSDIEKEVLPKLKAGKKGGGYICMSDHSVPPAVSFDNYRYLVELVKSEG